MDDFGSLLGSTFGRLGQQVASGVAAQIDGVAVSVGQALRDRGIATPGDPQQQQQQHHPQPPGGGVRSSRSAASSAAGTPSREEVKEGAGVELRVGLNRGLQFNPALLGVDPVLQSCCVFHYKSLFPFVLESFFVCITCFSDKSTQACYYFFFFCTDALSL